MNVAPQIIAILLLMGSGFLARRLGWLSERGTSELTRVLVNLVYPALIIASVPRLSARDLAENWLMPLMALVLAMTGLVLGALALRFLKAPSRSMHGSFLFQSVFNNYLFLALPLVLLLWGQHGVALLVYSSVVFEIALWTLGVFLLTRDLSLGERRRSLLNPALCVLMLTMAFVVLRDTVLGWRDDAWPAGGWAGELVHVVLFAADTLGQGTVAISMLIAGSRLATLHPGAVVEGRVWLLAAVRLVAVPAVVIPVLQWVPLQEIARGVLIVSAVMPCAVVSVFFSERFGGDKEFIAGSLLLTHLAALVTVPLFLAWAL